MKHSLLLFLVLMLALATGTSAQESDLVSEEYAEPVQRNMVVRDYSDYTVKAYSVSLYVGHFNGATFLDLDPLADRTRITEDGRPDELWPNDILAYDGTPLEEGRLKRSDGLRYRYDSARKEIESGPALGGRVGIFVSDN
ncbi:hypothetical protein DRQ50_06525, partial [bacterium]